MARPVKAQMGARMETFCLGDPPITVQLRRSAQARRISLRVSRLDGRVSLTLPKPVPRGTGEAFARSRLEWIRAQLAQVAPIQDCAKGLPFQGATLRIVPANLRSPRHEDGVLYVPRGRPKALTVWLREEARRQLTEASDRHASALGCRYSRITLRDTRSRWGSCSTEGALMYSWRLVMAPPHVADYVATHEVAHLVHMDHSAAFWAVVERLRPDWRHSRDWLRQQGATLHRVDFGD